VSNNIVFRVQSGGLVLAGSEFHCIWSFQGMESAEDITVSIEMVWTYWFTELM
jgi:hypothetical protein